MIPNQPTNNTPEYPGTEYVGTADGEIPNTTTPDTTTAGDELPMGDIDPDSTRSADETGQGGDPTEPAKNKAHPWNG